ncbi:hypothetical protein XENORESO_015104, partial [Xenotaenia resolanae]
RCFQSSSASAVSSSDSIPKPQDLKKASGFHSSWQPLALLPPSLKPSEPCPPSNMSHLQARHLNSTSAVSVLFPEKPHHCTLTVGSRRKIIQGKSPCSSSDPTSTPPCKIFHPNS